MDREPPAPSREVAQAAWIEPRLNGRWATVGSTVPTGFAAYARVLHGVDDPEYGVRRRWADVARETGRTVHPLVQWHALVGTADHLDFRGAVWDRGSPDRGNQPAPDLAAMLRVLAGHTNTPDDCWFAIWEGWNGVGSATSLPLVEHPGRRYLLLQGPLDSALGIGDRAPGWFSAQSPNLMWPRDRAWCVATEIDYDSTVVGGSAALIDALLASPDLEVWRVGPEDSLAFDADPVNEVPAPDPGGPVDLSDLEEVRRRVVLPVVRCLVRPDELEEVVVDVVEVTPPPYWVPRDAPAAEVGAEEWIRVRIRARGEVIEPLTWPPGSQDARLLAAELYDHLQDELAETRFAWGERREGSYELPPL